MTHGDAIAWPAEDAVPFGAFLGPWPARVGLDAQLLEQVDCGSHLREKVSYAVGPGQRAIAYVCIPTDRCGPLPAVLCHHQHAGDFSRGKSEVVSLAGDPDQAYARELADEGFITIAPDAIGFEERNWSTDGSNITWFELSTRLVQGQTLLASCLHEVSVALDYLVSRDDVDPTRLGFLGHSYGGRMALWALAYDRRITASVSNCGSIPYRHSYSRDTGLQAEFVVPGFAADHDIEDAIACFGQTSLLTCQWEGPACGRDLLSCQLRVWGGAPGWMLISAGTADRWSRGAAEVFDAVQRVLGDRVQLALYDTVHAFTPEMRARAYAFLHDRC